MKWQHHLKGSLGEKQIYLSFTIVMDNGAQQGRREKKL